MKAVTCQPMVEISDASRSAASPKSQGHGPRAGNEVRRQPLRRRGKLEIRHPAQHLDQHGVDLDPGDVLTQAAVGTGAERDVRVRIARQIQHVRPVKDRGITVRGPEIHDHLVALGDLLAG